MECIFCKIINNIIFSYTIYEDDLVKVFLDINPKANGHCLIVTKKHFLDIDDIDNTTLNHVMLISKKLKKMLEVKLNNDGLTIMQNNGKPQEVKHFHMHLIPTSNDEIIDVKTIYEILTKKEEN